MARLPKSVDIQAEMVANVLQVYVVPGDPVAAGDTWHAGARDHAGITFADARDGCEGTRDSSRRRDG